MGTVHQVPKKLAVGMKVVVFTRRHEFFLTAAEYKAGLRRGKWVKFEVISVCSDGWIGIRTLDKSAWTAVDSNGPLFIVVRAVEKPSQSEVSKARARKVYREKTQKLAALKAAQRASN